jgi:predicted secreted protein
MRGLITALILAGALWTQALADASLPVADVLNLDAQATREVPYDIAVVTLAIDRESKNSDTLSAEINKILAEAMAEAKKAGVSAESGGYYISPTYNNRNQRTGWHGRAEIILRSKDFTAIGKLSGELAEKMQMAGMSFDLSPERRQSEESHLIEEAVSNLKIKARTTVKLLGYQDFSIREMTLSQGGAMLHPQLAAMARGTLADAAPVPVEGGKARISVTLSGSLQMKR